MWDAIDILRLQIIINEEVWKIQENAYIEKTQVIPFRKPIPGFSRYTIDITGKIHNGFRYLRPAINRGQYVILLYNDNGQRIGCRVHKLMELTYLTPEPGKILYHKNGDRLDNFLINFGYIERKKLAKLTGGMARRKPVAKMSQAGEIVEVYPSARSAARNNYMSYQTIIDRCNGKVKNKIAPDGYIYAWDS